MNPSLQKFLGTAHDGVFYIGHASALIRLNQELYLFDPIWDHKPYGEFWTFHPEQINCDAILDQVKGVFISHIHEDHVCMPILKRLPPGCWIRSMEGRPNLRERILQTGATGEDYSPLVWHEIRPGIEVMFLPHAFNTIDSSVFIRSKNFCVYVGSDNFLADYRNMWLKDQNIQVDIAMVPYAFIHWYPRLMNMPKNLIESEVRRLNEQSIFQAQYTINAMKPEYVIPFGNNLLYSEGGHPLNRDIAQPANLPTTPITSKHIETGGFILKGGPGQYYTHYERNKKRFPSVKLPRMDANVELTEGMFEIVQDKLKKVPKRIRRNFFVVNGLVMNLETMEVWTGDIREMGLANITEFDFDKTIFMDWITGIYTFEQALGTRRFLCTRTPNVYNLEVFEFMNNYL